MKWRLIPKECKSNDHLEVKRRFFLGGTRGVSGGPDGAPLGSQLFFMGQNYGPSQYGTETEQLAGFLEQSRETWAGCVGLFSLSLSPPLPLFALYFFPHKR
jgi:hypothetical protein